VKENQSLIHQSEILNFRGYLQKLQKFSRLVKFSSFNFFFINHSFRMYKYRWGLDPPTGILHRIA
jgi:hypothetical protein